MTRLQRTCLLVAAASLLAMLGLTIVADSHSPQPWSVPDSAIRPITTPSGEQQPDRSFDAAMSVPVNSGHAGRQDQQSAASPRLPRGIGTEADHEVPTATPVALATARPAASHSLADLAFVGVASTYGPGWDPRLPQGPGWRFRVCGPGGCLTLVSTDKGPTIPGRIVDLDVRSFEAVCGVPWTRGLCSVSLVIIGRAS